MPRPASAVWSHFRRDGPTKRAVCKYCQHNMVGLVTRMRIHLARKCPECPINVKSEMFEADMNRKMDLTAMVPTGANTSGSVGVGANANMTNVSVGAVGLGVGTSSPHHHHHAQLHHHAHAHLLKKPRRGRGLTGPHGTGSALDDKADLDSYVAKAILGAALPVSAVENTSFIKMVKRLNPTYELPSAFTLATSALDLEYTEVQLKLRAEVLDASSVCLGVESWSTPTPTIGAKRSILSFVINTPNPGVFAFENTGEAPHTAEVLVEKIEHVMTQIGTGKVSVIVMDLSNAHMKQAALALEAKYPNVTFLPSCAHAMAAMVHDILSIPSLANTLAVCRLIATYFSQNHLAKAAFARVSEPLQALEASYPLHEPVDESAVAQLECLFGVERNHHSFEVLLAENGPLSGLDAHAKEQMINLTFWEELTTYTGLLEPFLDLLKTFDADYPLLSTFYHRFTQLWAHLQKFGDLASKVQQIMSDHWQVIRHPAMYTAYILDPRFPDAGLVTDVSNEVLAYLKRSADPPTEAHIVAELTRYTGRVGMFADDAVWESAQKCSPIHWWKGFIGGSVPHLQSVALRNLCFPASCGLAKHRREMFDKIYQMNSKYMSEEQASKAALVYLNTNLSSAGGDLGLSNETLV